MAEIKIDSKRAPFWPWFLLVGALFGVFYGWFEAGRASEAKYEHRPSVAERAVSTPAQR